MPQDGHLCLRVLFRGQPEKGVGIHLSRGNIGFRLPWGENAWAASAHPTLPKERSAKKSRYARRAGIYAHARFSEGSLKLCGQRVPILLPTVCFQAGTQPCGKLFRAVFVQIAQAYRRICAAGVGEQVVHAVSAIKRVMEQA